MARINLDNGVYGETWRNAVNSNFTELYNYSVRTNVAGQIAAVTLKGTPVDADMILIEDSADSNNKKRITIGSIASDSTLIEDAAGTTGLYTEETANRLVGHSANTGTSLIFEMFEGTGTPVSVFQIDGNGHIFNNSNNVLKYSNSWANVFLGGALGSSAPASVGRYSVGIGLEALNNVTSATHSTAIGWKAGKSQSTQSNGVFIGAQSGELTNAKDATYIGTLSGYQASGEKNVLAGYQTGRTNTGSFVTAVGSLAGYTGNGSNTLFLGYYAGAWNTASNKVIIDTVQRADEATENSDALIVATTNATKSSQVLTINAATTISNDLTGDIFTIDDGSTDVLTVDNDGNLDNTGYVDSESYHKSTGQIKGLVTKSVGTTALTANFYHTVLDGTSNTVTLTLPAIDSTTHGTIYWFSCSNASNTCTVQTLTGGDSIGMVGSATSFTMTAGQRRGYQADDTLNKWLEVY